MDALARIMTVIVLLSSVFWAIPPAAATWEETKLTASGGAAGGGFGTAVAFSEGTAVIGAPWDEYAPAWPDRGFAYVFEEVGGVWTQTRLSASNGQSFDYFGHSVAIDGDTVAVGAPGDDGLFIMDTGSVRVFEKSGGVWTPTATLVDTFGAQGDEFGWSVAVSGDTVLVGAPCDDDLGSNSGSAFVFEKVGGGWTETKLLPTGGPAGDHFGWSVALYGDVALVGAPHDYFIGPDRGSVYVFEKDGGGWTLSAKLGECAWVGQLFGWSVALSADTALVGAPGTNGWGFPPPLHVGSAYVFERIGGIWTNVDHLYASDPEEWDEFGWSVGVYLDCIGLVGAPFDDDNGGDSGSAYSFAKINGDWTRIAKLTASDGAQWDVFGLSVALSESSVWPHPVELLIGAQGDNSNSGSGYVFVDSDCNENGNPDFWDIFSGTSEDCQPNGIPDECDILIEHGGFCDPAVSACSTDLNGNGIPDECESIGDLNCDGVLNAFDVDPFVLALTDPAGYTAAYPDCDIMNGDCNGDGVVNAFDIDPFVELLTGG